MEKIKIFIASSSELKTEREKIELLIGRLNTQFQDENKSLYIKPVLWEQLKQSFYKGRIQDLFNKEMLSCHIVVFLFWKKIGDYTYEEFQKAYDSFINKRYPNYIYAFFKDTQISINEINDDIFEIVELKKKICDYEQIYKSFNSIDELDSQLTYQLKLVIDEIHVNNKLNEDIRLVKEDLFNIIHPFKRESSIVQIRCNPIRVDLFNFHEIINEIDEDSDRRTLVEKVEKAITSVALDQAIVNFNKYCIDIKDSFKTQFSLSDDLKNNYNNYCCDSKYFKEIEQLIDSFIDELIITLNSQSNLVSEIQTKFIQIEAYFPRYKSILTKRHSFLDFFLGLATGFLLGGITNTFSWNNWSETTDEDFIKLFSNAVQDFSKSSLEYLEIVEKESEIVINNFITNYESLFSKCIDSMSQSENYKDFVNDMYTSFYSTQEDFDNDAKEYIELVIENLRENGFDKEKEIKLKKLIGI